MFIPPGEKIIEKRKCRISGQDFVITEKESELYDQLSPVIGGIKCSLPYPTLCPNERQIRRMMWRNYDHFYKGHCCLTGKEIISTYNPEMGYKVASLESWWSDNWNPHEYSLKVDFARPFFDQSRDLDRLVPHFPLSVTRCENSSYTNLSINNKNCYLCVRVADCEDCYYSCLVVRCKNCYDCTNITDSEYLYECVRLTKSFRCFCCVDCENCHESYFLTDCSGCRDCFGSCNLKNARFVYNNIQMSEGDYHEKISHTLGGLEDFGDLRKKFVTYCERFPKKFMTGYNNEKSFGNYLFSNSEALYAFECQDCEKIRYVYGGHRVRDSFDISFGYYNEKSFEVSGGTGGYGHLFCAANLADCRDILYCRECVLGTSDCFGCNSLKRGKYSILNTPYSKEEYEKTALRLIDHMKSTGEWGEFFRGDYSPYAYNESAAHMHFPLERTKVVDRGWWWHESPTEQKKSHSRVFPIKEYDEKRIGYEIAKKNIDTLLGENLICTHSYRPFKILPQELAFYIENNLPLPHLHPSVRSENRMKQTLPMDLYDGTCDECGQAFHTSYAPERPEKILCENCYRNLVY